MNNDICRVTTGEARLSYAHLFKPYAFQQGQEEKYSVTVLVPKADAETKARIDAAIEEAKRRGIADKWNGVCPPVLATPVHDGDGVRPSDGMPFGDECKGHWVFTASAKAEYPPEVVDANGNPIVNHSEAYSGMYGRVCVNFFPYAFGGKKGIGCGLGPVQKLRDGEALGGVRITAAQAFGAPIPQQPAAGAPAYLALERTKTYRPQEKVYACSTPTVKTNYIWELHEGADEVRHYFVKCPHCGEWIELLFKQIRFDEDENKAMSAYERAQTAQYVCQECGCVIEDSDKPRMLREGQWRAVKKWGVGKPRSVGFWLPSLYSVFLKWSDVAEEFLNSKDDPERLQNFTNSWLAEAWEDTQLKTTEELVMERQTDLEEFIVPSWAKLLTAGVDVQETSLYYTIRAFGDYTTSQCVTHGQALSFGEIERVMNGEFKTEDGRVMVVCLALIDSGFQADDTYDFCIDNADWALPCKGSSSPMASRYKISKVDKTDSRAYGTQLVIVDGDKFKDSIASRMRRKNGRGSWMVHKGCDKEYAQQVTAEHKTYVRAGGGTRRLKWTPKHSHAANHYLDCEAYAMAAAEMLGVRRLHLEAEEAHEKKANKGASEPYAPEESWIRQNDDWI